MTRRHKKDIAVSLAECDCLSMPDRLDVYLTTTREPMPYKTTRLVKNMLEVVIDACDSYLVPDVYDVQNYNKASTFVHIDLPVNTNRIDLRITLGDANGNMDVLIDRAMKCKAALEKECGRQLKGCFTPKPNIGTLEEITFD